MTSPNTYAKQSNKRGIAITNVQTRESQGLLETNMITSNVIASALRKGKSVGVLGRVIARHNPCKYSIPLLTISTLSFALYDLLLDFGLSTWTIVQEELVHGIKLTLKVFDLV